MQLFADDPKEPKIIGECVIDLSPVMKLGEHDGGWRCTRSRHRGSPAERSRLVYSELQGALCGRGLARAHLLHQCGCISPMLLGPSLTDAAPPAERPADAAQSRQAGQAASVASLVAFIQCISVNDAPASAPTALNGQPGRPCRCSSNGVFALQAATIRAESGTASVRLWNVRGTKRTSSGGR